ncbi:hypothetical protein [Snodgrassella communis]|jgi:PBP1b-binding outer membrane lipoprotein LpoB|uniref:hypothetical protein n=1 Tax=Snodgrassella communis TaxID=2946699 RepID=UPI000C1F659D|nr:hypothetical protein [Snodgrassella communis]
MTSTRLLIITGLMLLLSGCSISDWYNNYQEKQPYNYSDPKAVVIGKDGYIRLVDRHGNMVTLDKRTNKPIKMTRIPIHEVNGKRYFNFEGKRYHADPPR